MGKGSIGITGASGFVGKAIIAEAKRRGYHVVAYSRRPERLIAGADEMRSLADPKAIDLDGLMALVHLAGEPIAGLWTPRKKRLIRSSRVGLTRDLVESMAGMVRSRRPPVFVCASAIGLYGSRGDEVIDETSDVGFGFLAEVCRDWEVEADRAVKLGVRVVTPRLGLVLGKKGLLRSLRPIFWLGLGGRLGHGRQWMSWIAVNDAARVFLHCVEETGIAGRVNCVSPEALTNADFTKRLARHWHRWAILPVPGWLLRCLPWGMSSLFLFSQRVNPVALRAHRFTWESPDFESALRNM
jgi:uncharacterized protein